MTPSTITPAMPFDPSAGRLRVTAVAESFPLAEPFVISRGAKTVAEVVVATVTQDGAEGRGECVPYVRYGESVASVLAAIARAGEAAGGGDPRAFLPAGAARNAVDCALWDLFAKRTGQSVAGILAGGALRPVETCFTLSLGTPEAMAEKARRVPQQSILKLKLGGAGDAQRMATVRRARPDARLVADANEAWTETLLGPLLDAAAEARVELIEQPLPAGADAALAEIARPVPVCADESAHTADDVGRLAGRYDAVNIKLDKAGGLTAALDMAKAARGAALRIMTGCMVASSLAMAPALILAQDADWVDLDGPLLLARDRPHAIRIAGGIVAPPSAALWG